MSNRHNGTVWYRRRTLDLLAGVLDRRAVTALVSALLAGTALTASIFRPLLALVGQMESERPQGASVSAWLLVLLALSSIAVSLLGLAQSRERRVAWVALCFLGLVAVACTVVGAVAPQLLLRCVRPE